MRDIISEAVRHIQFLPIIALIGIALICYGVALVSFPASMIVAGLLLIIVAIDARY